MISRFSGLCIVVFVSTCGAELAFIHYSNEADALAHVYDQDQDPLRLDFEDARYGHARLEAELGFMHMDLDELREFFKNNVTGFEDQYAYQSWKLPSLFVAEKGGDCEDYVLFALAVLDHSAYKLTPIIGTHNNVGHAWLLATEQDGTIWLIDSMNFMVLPDGELPSSYQAETYLDDMLNDNSLLAVLT